MADSVQIPVEFTGWDKVISSIEGTTKASKELGDQMKKALMGEVLVQSINRVGSSIGGVEGAAVSAVGSIAQGFMQGGPVGAAIAATGVAFTSLFQVIEYGKAELVKQDAMLEKIAIERVNLAAQVRRAKDKEDQAELDRLTKLAQDSLDVEDAAIAKANAARAAQRERERQWASTAAVYVHEQQKAAAARELEILNETEDTKTVLLQRAGQKRIDIANSAAEIARRDAFDQWAEDQKQAESRRKAAEASAMDAATSMTDLELKESDIQQRAFEDMAAIGASAREQFASSIGGAVGALTQLDAAQIMAAASSKDFGAAMGASALDAVGDILSSVAQQASAKAALNFAEGVAASAGVLTAPLAPGFFAAASAFATTAALAGGGAIAVNTAASAVRPAAAAPRAASAPTQSGGSSSGSSSRGGSGGGASPTVVVNFGAAYVTEDAVGRGIEQALKKSGRYR